MRKKQLFGLFLMFIRETLTPFVSNKGHYLLCSLIVDNFIYFYSQSRDYGSHLRLNEFRNGVPHRALVGCLSIDRRFSIFAQNSKHSIHLLGSGKFHVTKFVFVIFTRERVGARWEERKQLGKSRRKIARLTRCLACCILPMVFAYFIALAYLYFLKKVEFLTTITVV